MWRYRNVESTIKWMERVVILFCRAELLARTMVRLSPPKKASSVFAITSLGRSAGVGGAKQPPPLICEERSASLPAMLFF